MNLNEVSKKYLMLNPVNATSGGQYSSNSGLPLIKFDISSADDPTLLDLTNLRISGKITVNDSAGAAITETENHFYDGMTGRFSNLVDMVTVSSKRLNQVVERVNNYSRIVPSLISGLHNANDIHTALYHEGDHVSTTFLSRHVISAGSGAAGKSFSSPLYCGVLNSGQDLDVSKNGMGGLVIEILLKPSVSCIFGSDAQTSGDVVVLSDLVLTVPQYQLSGSMAQSRMAEQNQYSFNSLSSVFQVVNSATSVVAFTPGLSRVSSIFMNFINTNEIGNQLYNSCRLGNVGQVRELRFSKNGRLYPISFRLETDEQNNDTLSTDNRYRARCMIDRNYLEALNIKRYYKTNRTSLAWNDWESGVVNRSQTQNRDGTQPGTAEGMGILFDAYGSGEDLSQTIWSFELEVSGTAADGLDGSAANSQGVYVVMLNKNTIFMNQNGIEVQR
tara:strand:- start:2356 stop:3690 length:1335 start_codon:yes stop_codon:yes gene_type:complete